MSPRIFHSAPLGEGTEVTVTGGAAAHLGKVLRLRQGDELILFNGDGLDHSAQIISISRGDVVVVIGTNHAPRNESPVDVTLLQGICRNHRMDMLIQKSTELGVHAIQPLVCERSVVKIEDQRIQKKVTHWQGVAISACEQCGRSRIPDIVEPQSLMTALGRLDAKTTRLMLDPDGDDSMESAIGAPGPIVLLIGPEGGLTDAETAAAADAGFRRVRLGPRILRTETAPVAALSIIQYLKGDLQNQ
jgi:16S rRNA (uracil1498-N3)-methyltransferase